MAASIQALTPDVIRAVARHTAAVASGTPRGTPRRPSSPGSRGYPQEEAFQEPRDQGGHAFWQACERAHEMYSRTANTSPKSSRPASPAPPSPGRPTTPTRSQTVGGPVPSVEDVCSPHSTSTRSPRSPHCASPRQQTFSRATVEALNVNDEGASVCLGDSSSAHVAGGDGTGKFYCGRRLGPDAIPGSDGQCGPSGGPQCKSCKRFQVQAGAMLPKQAKQTKQTKQPTGTQGPERFFYDTATYTGTFSKKTAPAPTSQPAKSGRGSISVDELVARLCQSNDRREQKLNIKREEINKAEMADLTFQPKLNSNSNVLAGGVESLEVRQEKITQKRAEKLEKARARQEEAEENELTGRPCITSKAHRTQRGYEALMGWDEHKQHKIIQKQHQLQEEQLQECTFKPNVGPQSKRIVQRQGEDRGLMGDRPVEVHSRLYDDSQRHRRDREANAVPDIVESRAGSATSTTFRKNNVSGTSLSTSSRLTSSQLSGSRSGAGKHASASAEGFGAAAGSQPLSFDAFMRSLATENGSNGQRVPGWSASGEVLENELIADSAFVVNSPNGNARPAGERSALSSPRGTPRGTPRTRTAMMSEDEDEIFMADAAPRPSPYPSARPQSPDTLAEIALPEWVKFAVPAPPPVPHGTVGRAVSTTENSARSTPQQASRGANSTWSLSARPPIGSPAPGAGVNDPNVMTYTNKFDDVFRIGYGGSLPGTLADTR